MKASVEFLRLCPADSLSMTIASSGRREGQCATRDREDDSCSNRFGLLFHEKGEDVLPLNLQFDAERRPDIRALRQASAHPEIARNFAHF